MFNQLQSEEDHKNIVEQGFTLVELLIVIVIMGILAGIVVFAVGNLTDSAGKNACATEGDTFSTAVQAYKADSSHLGSLPTLPSGGDINSIASILYAGGAGTLSKATVGHGILSTGTAVKQWTYNSGNGAVDTSACA